MLRCGFVKLVCPLLVDCGIHIHKDKDRFGFSKCHAHLADECPGKPEGKSKVPALPASQPLPYFQLIGLLGLALLPLGPEQPPQVAQQEQPRRQRQQWL